MVGGSLGDFVPGQLGATHGAFALAAPWLGIAVSDAVAVAISLHFQQVLWGVDGGTTAPFWWREEDSTALPA